MPKIPTKSNSFPSEIVFREVSLMECEKLVKEHHYSHRLPSAVKLSYGCVTLGPPRVLHACCLFSIATGRWEEPLWELTRLVRLPEFCPPAHPSLTMLISKALGRIRQSSAMDLIVSFADAEEDHHGGIYQASSWIYDGMRNERLDGFNIDGEFVPARTCNALYGTSSEIDLPRKLRGKSVVSHYDQGKHCYWKALSKTGMQKAVRMGLRSQPYPKPMLNGQETNYAVDEQQRKGIVALPGKKNSANSSKVVRVDTSNEL